MDLVKVEVMEAPDGTPRTTTGIHPPLRRCDRARDSAPQALGVHLVMASPTLGVLAL